MSHYIIDNYFDKETALKLESEFPDYNDPAWFVYDNAIENKKTLNSWERFPPTTYKIFHELCSTGNADFGLHGGGWHIHANDGNLNPHLDYEVHPKLGLKRLQNLIIYLSSDYKPEYGGFLGFWEDGKLVKSIEPKFNRAVIFDTPGCWHGLATKFTGTYRKSIAVYYLGEKGEGRTRALYAPREDQKGDKEIEALITRRAEGKYI